MSEIECPNCHTTLCSWCGNRITKEDTHRFCDPVWDE